MLCKQQSIDKQFSFNFPIRTQVYVMYVLKMKTVFLQFSHLNTSVCSVCIGDFVWLEGKKQLVSQRMGLGLMAMSCVCVVIEKKVVLSSVWNFRAEKLAALIDFEHFHLRLHVSRCPFSSYGSSSSWRERHGDTDGGFFSVLGPRQGFSTYVSVKARLLSCSYDGLIICEDCGSQIIQYEREKMDVA